MTNDHMGKVRSRGYWRVVIRPAAFVEGRVANILDLPKILATCAVRLRGWDYPHINERSEQVGADWVSQGVDWEN